jgi:N-methylhydantoinase A
MVRIGIDIGGTFTDLCLTTERGENYSAKLLTTPDDPARGFLEILRRALETDPAYRLVGQIVHATTVATNSILEAKTARMGMITTAGFRDVLEIGRHFRRDIYNLFLQKPPVLVPRRRRLEVSQRVGGDGQEIRPLVRDEVETAVKQLLADDVEVILVCYLHSYAYPAHELETAAIIRELSDLPVVMSHAACREHREYERFSTAAVHGAVMPRVQSYLRNIVAGLEGTGVSAPVSVMQSNGGMAPARIVQQQPGLIVESGPAAGVIAAVEIGRRLDIEDLIPLDMGGTTAKATLIRAGQITLNTDYEVGGGLQGGFGTGYLIRMPVVDLVEIGTGGGSLVHVDEVGLLHVGPQSAGADPGPACYGRGGRGATITDANLVLGRLSSDHFAGGQFRLHTEAAYAAVRDEVAGPLSMEVEQAAEGIIALANAQMVRALQLVSVERGLDPRQFTMVAFGGAGPMHAAELAGELGCPRVIIPPEAGVQSAWGLLVADARRDFSEAIPDQPVDPDPQPLRQQYAAMVAIGAEELSAAGFADDDITHRLSVDARYAGQGYELTVVLPEPAGFDGAMIARIHELFHQEHERRYGRSDKGATVQWVALRAGVVGRVPRPRPPVATSPTEPLEKRILARQPMIWSGRSYDAPVFDRPNLGRGDRFAGPALVLQADASLAVPPDVTMTVEATGDIILHNQEAP